MEHLDTSVIEVFATFVAGSPIFLMLERWPTVVQIPGRAGHILRNVGVDLLALLINLGWRDTRFPSFLKLLLSSVVLMVLEQRVCRSHIASHKYAAQGRPDNPS